jgi:hypothetical protein
VSDDRVPAPLEALVRAVAGGAHDEDDERATTFAKGLALGALVGAAIAGSTIWQRRHARAAIRPTTGPAADAPAGGAKARDAEPGEAEPGEAEPRGSDDRPAIEPGSAER